MSVAAPPMTERSGGRAVLGLAGVMVVCAVGGLAFWASRQGASLEAIALDDGGWLTVTIGGLVAGLILMPAALGLGLVSAIGGPPQLAQSGFVALGAAVSLAAAWLWPGGAGPVPTIGALPVALLLGGIAGAAFERLAIVPVDRRPGAAIVTMVAAFALSEWAVTALAPFTRGDAAATGGIVLAGAAFGAAALAACALALRASQAGTAVRAAAEDAELLSVLGYEMGRLRRWGHVVSGALAAGTGVVVGAALPSLMASDAAGLSDLTVMLLVILALSRRGGIVMIVAATLVVALIDAYCAALAPGLAPVIGLLLVAGMLGLGRRGAAAAS